MTEVMLLAHFMLRPEGRHKMLVVFFKGGKPHIDIKI